MMDQQTIIILVLLLVAIFVAGCFCTKFKEGFSPFPEKNFKFSPLKKKHFTSEEFLTNGSAYKYKEGEGYSYYFKFNLPIPYGGAYNKIDGVYCVYAGASPEEVKKLGELARSSDGWFKYRLVTPEDFKYAKIVFEAPGIKKVIVEKEL